jgi:hypothetical protein
MSLTSGGRSVDVVGLRAENLGDYFLVLAATINMRQFNDYFKMFQLFLGTVVQE